ncbi:MAG: EamA family transporter [Bacteroidota bacterium]
MLAEERRAYLELHLAVLLYGLTAILGDLIQLTALVLVWWRVFLTSGSLVPFVKPRQLIDDLGRGLFWRFAGIGVLVALHWVTFYGAIKLSNASICLVCMATTSFFTAFLEPLIVKRPFRWYELFLGLLIVPGMALVVRNIQVEMIWGVVAGLASAFLAATFATFNKKYIGNQNPTRITFLELGSAWAFLSVVLAVMLISGQNVGELWPTSLMDWVYLLILAFLCTNLAYTLSLRALRHISAFAANLTVNLEPVYGIILAWLLLNEQEELSPGFYWGVVIILLAVLSYPLLSRYMRKREQELQ